MARFVGLYALTLFTLLRSLRCLSLLLLQSHISFETRIQRDVIVKNVGSAVVVIFLRLLRDKHRYIFHQFKAMTSAGTGYCRKAHSRRQAVEGSYPLRYYHGMCMSFLLLSRLERACLNSTSHACFPIPSDVLREVEEQWHHCHH
jgi:hypothetical protein